MKKKGSILAVCLLAVLCAALFLFAACDTDEEPVQPQKTISATLSEEEVLVDEKVTLTYSASGGEEVSVVYAKDGGEETPFSGTEFTAEERGTYVFTFSAEGYTDVTLTLVVKTEQDALFAGGWGTAEAPYQIATAEQFLKIGQTDDLHYVLSEDIDLRSGTTIPEGTAGWNAYIEVNGGSIDGDGHTVTIAPKTSLATKLVGVTLKDMTVSNAGQQSDAYNDAPLIAFNAQDVVMDGVTTQGTVNLTGNCAAFVIYVYGDLTLRNCVNEASLYGLGGQADYNAVFAGYIMASGAGQSPLEHTLVFENCVNRGELVCGKAALLFGNVPSVRALAEVSAEGCKNEGTLRSTYTGSYAKNDVFATAATGTVTLTYDGVKYAQEDAAQIEVGGTVIHDKADTGIVATFDGNELSFTKSQYEGAEEDAVVSYVVTYGLYVTWNIPGGAVGTDRYYISERITADGSSSYTSGMKYLGVTTDDSLTPTGNSFASADGKTVSIVKDGEETEYYFIDNDQFEVTTGARFTIVTITSYDADGNFVSSVSVPSSALPVL